MLIMNIINTSKFNQSIKTNLYIAMRRKRNTNLRYVMKDNGNFVIQFYHAFLRLYTFLYNRNE